MLVVLRSQKIKHFNKFSQIFDHLKHENLFLGLSKNAEKSLYFRDVPETSMLSLYIYKLLKKNKISPEIVSLHIALSIEKMSRIVLSCRTV